MDIELIQIVRILGLTTLAFVVSVLWTPLLTFFLYRYKLGKQIRTEGAPIFQKLHKAKSGTPTMGGILIWGTTIAFAFIFMVLGTIFPGDTILSRLNFVNRSETFLPLGALLLAAIIGLVDDLRGVLRIGAKGGGVGVRTKLILYSAIAGLGAWWFIAKLGWTALYIPFVGLVNLGPWFIVWFLFIIVATAFSINETDGLDGLAGGVILSAFSALGVIAFLEGHYNLATLSGVIVGALLAFLWFNIFPARFFMGDTGSMGLGITLGVIAMLTHASLFLPFILFIPMIESLSVILQVLSKRLRGKKIFLSSPLHHHLEARGWPEAKITMRFWIISAIMTTLGLLLALLSFQIAPLL